MYSSEPARVRLWPELFIGAVNQKSNNFITIKIAHKIVATGSLRVWVQGNKPILTSVNKLHLDVLKVVKRVEHRIYNRVPISDVLPWSSRNSSTETEFFRHTVCIIDRPFVPTKNKVEKDFRNKSSTFVTSSVRAATWSAVQPSLFWTLKSAPESCAGGQ